MGWRHYLSYKPNPTVLCFRRPIDCHPRTGLAPEGWTPFPGEINFWKIEDFEVGDHIWVKEQIADTLISNDEEEYEFTEGTPLEVAEIDEESGNVCVKSNRMQEPKWIDASLLHCLTKYDPEQTHSGLSKPKPSSRGRKRHLESSSTDKQDTDREFGKDLEQSKRRVPPKKRDP